MANIFRRIPTGRLKSGNLIASNNAAAIANEFFENTTTAEPLGKVNVDGIYKNIDVMFANIDGVWKQVANMHVNVDSAWKPLA